MRSLRILPALMLVGATSVAAQSPTYGLGRAPTTEEVRVWDISISPTGMELPEGSGTVAEGERVYRRSCRRCHGVDGTEGRAPRLVKRERPEGTHPWNLGRILPIRAPYGPR